MINRLVDNCRKSPVHREHAVTALLILTLGLSAATNIPRDVFAILMEVMVFGRDLLPLFFDELEEVRPVPAPVRTEDNA